MYTTHEITLTEHLSWWDSIQDLVSQQYFMYEFNGEALGVVAFTGIDHRNQNSSWAFYASPRAPKGTGSRMEVLALDHAFNVLNLHKLCCEVLSFNYSVIKLHEKFGFKVEGILREQYKREGTFIDIFRLGLLSVEWAESRDRMIAKLIRLSRGQE